MNTPEIPGANDMRPPSTERREGESDSDHAERVVRELADYHTQQFLEDVSGLTPENPVIAEIYDKLTGNGLKGAATVRYATQSLGRRLVQRRGDTGDTAGYASEIHADLHKDELTGLLDRSGLNRFLDEIKAPQALLFIDLTNFKAVNDKISHNRGDEALKDIARLLDDRKHCIRKGDALARVGGDEFVIVLADKEVDLDTIEGGERTRDANEDPERALEVTTKRIASLIGRFLEDESNADIIKHGFNVAVGGVVWEAGESLESVKERASLEMKRAKVLQHATNGSYR